MDAPAAAAAAAAGKKPFRAVIVGGGPVGLTLAHTLAQANIDFVVLEARDTVFADEGASIILYPGALRIYAQLGILEAALKLSFPITLLRIVNPDGKLARETENLKLVKELYDRMPVAFLSPSTDPEQTAMAPRRRPSIARHS